MSGFLESVSTIISVFHQHAKEDGGCSSLSQRKMKEFIEWEFADVIAKPHDPQTVDKILQFLEWDGDGEIDFNEFLLLVFRVAKACYWYQPEGPRLLQRTKLATSGKSPQEPGSKNRGSQWQLQTCEPQAQPNQRSQANKPATQRPQRADRGSQNQAELLREERSRYNSHGLEQRAGERRRHETREPEGLGPKRPHQSYLQEPLEIELGAYERCEEGRHIDERRRDDERECGGGDDGQDQEWEEQQRQRREEPVRERRVDRELDLELDISKRRSRRTREREERDDTAKQRETRDRCDCRTQDAEEEDPRRQRESLRYERTRERTVAAAEADLSVRRVTRVLEPRDDLERRDRDCEEPRQERRVCRGPEREELVRERRVDRELDLELNISERRSRRTREREERDDTAKQRETRDRRDCRTEQPEEDPRRQRESLRYERTRERTVAAAEADLSVRRVTRVLEPRDDLERRDRDCEEPHEERRVCRGPEREELVRERRVDRELDLELDISERRSRRTREREERDDTAKQRETRDRRDCRTEQPEEDPRRDRESLRYERTRERTVAAAEADLSVRRVTRVLEPRDAVERRDRDCEEPREERRVCIEPEREELVRERRVDRELDLELDISERRSRRTREREERDDTAKQRETRDRCDCRTQDAEEEDPRRDRESLRYERTRERTVAAAEADLSVRRVTRVLEPRDDLERRDRDCEEPQEERRVCRGPEREELVRERRVDRELDLELDISERRSRRTREREERDDTAKQRETRDRRDCRTEQPEEDPRRDRESLRYERTRERTVAAAEADLSVRRVTRVLEPRDAVERRDRDCEEPREERRVCIEPEREELVRERRVDRELDLELDISERRSRRTREREERDDTAKQRETRDRCDCRTQDAEEEDPRRDRESLRYERTRERTVAAAEADLSVRRVTRVLEPRDDLERRDHPRDCEEPREERRVCNDPEREEPVTERRVDRELDLELDISERRSRRTREREERDDTAKQRETRDRHDCRTEQPEEDPRRQRESLRYERTRERTVAAAEADLSVRRVTRVLEPRDDLERRDRDCEEPQEERRVCRGPEREELVRERRVDRELDLELDISERRSRRTREREERDDTAKQRETRDRRDCRTQDADENDPRRDRESLRYERTRERTVAAAEADLSVRRVTRVLEPRDAVERRDRDCEEPRQERRVCRGPEREELVRERRVDRELDLELDISERRSRRTLEREERDDTAKQRETRDRRDCRTQDAEEEDPRRQRESLRYERTRERTVAAAEADLSVRRVTRVLEPRDDLERRDHPRDCEEPREERRVCRAPEREELVRERRVNRELDLELDISERRSRRTREREERDDTAKQRETRDRCDCRTEQPEEDPRRDRESLRYERTRERTVAAAEADLSVRRVTRVLEPRDDLERRDRDCEEPQEERRVCRGPEREELVRERRVDRELDLELDISERRSRWTREREERGTLRSSRDTRDRISLQILEEEEGDIIFSEPLDEEQRDNGLLDKEETHEPTRPRAPEDESRGRERSLYQTMVMDDRELCPPGEQAAVTDMRIRYIPEDPAVQPEVRLLPQPCQPQTIAYLVRVIQNLNDPGATTYEITCQHPSDPGQPLYVKKCHVSPQPPAAPCDGRKRPGPRPQRDEPEPLQEGDTPASRSQESTGDPGEPQERSETGVKEACQASASEPDGVKGKTKEGRRQHPRLPDGEEEQQPREDGSKAAREQISWEPESSCSLSQEAKSCPPLPQAPEPRETVRRCQEDAEVPLTKKSYQPRQEDASKRNPRQGSNSQPQREEEPHLHTKQSCLVSQEAPSCPDRGETKAS